MSDGDANDESSNASTSSDESEDIRLTGLVATRAKRQTAGNKYEVNLGEYDDPDLQALFAEQDGESEDYEGSDQYGDDDDVMDSSSSDEDAGPPKEGEPEELEGEKELKKAERAEQTRKRKAQQAKLAVPAWNKKVKRVTLAEEVHADDGSSSAIDAPIRKKKIERKQWRPSGDDIPTRQSSRASAVAFRETIHVNLQESAERSRKHKTALSETNKRERANRRADLTLEERLEKCRSIETETAKELGRFEREEAERVRLREEALMAKRRRTLDGPLIRTLTTSALYENGKPIVKRLVHGSQPVEEILAEEQRVQALQAELEDDAKEVEPGVLVEPAAEAIKSLPIEREHIVSEVEPQSADQAPTLAEADADKITIDANGDTQMTDDATGTASNVEPATIVEDTVVQSETKETAEDMVKTEAIGDDDGDTSHNTQDQSEDTQQTQQVQAPVSWLSGIHEYASTPASKTEDGSNQPALPTSIATADEVPPTDALQPQPVDSSDKPEVPPPIIREQAQRHLLILEDFPSLEAVITKRSKAVSALEPTAVAQLLIPESYPTFTDEEAAYLRKTRKTKQELHPKRLCALTSWQGKYRDPNTGIVFADVAAYKMLQRLIAGGCRWNSMLECWSAPFVGLIGRPAHGVPEGFDTTPSKSTTKENS